MPRGRLELPRPFEHMNLNHACLPVPAPGRVGVMKYPTEYRVRTLPSIAGSELLRSFLSNSTRLSLLIHLTFLIISPHSLP